MNTYQAFYKGREVQIEATTSREAQQLACVCFKAKKAYEITIVLVSVEGTQYTHSPASL